MNVAIVTGASSGMGREFAECFDSAGLYDEIWVIARRKENLDEIKSRARTAVRVIACDLTQDSGIESIRSQLAESEADVRVLVNAGGYGRFGEFEKLDLNEQLGMIELNNAAMVKMTHICLPYMSAGAEIYQIGSLSAFQPVPYMAVYAATKSFVLSYSRALGRELRGRGIKVMAVCPFWVKTEFFDRARTDDTITYYSRYYTSKQVVSRALRDMKRGKDVSVCGAASRWQVRLVKLMPHRLVMNVWCRQQKK